MFFLVFVLIYNTCGVFTVIFWRSLTELDLSNPAPITKTQLKLDLCMKYTLNMIYFINQCVSVSQIGQDLPQFGRRWCWWAQFIKSNLKGQSLHFGQNVSSNMSVKKKNIHFTCWLRLAKPSSGKNWQNMTWHLISESFTHAGSKGDPMGFFVLERAP